MRVASIRGKFTIDVSFGYSSSNLQNSVERLKDRLRNGPGFSTSGRLPHERSSAEKQPSW